FRDILRRLLFPTEASGSQCGWDPLSSCLSSSIHLTRSCHSLWTGGFQPLETQAWCSEKDMYTLQLKTGDPNFSPTLEFALQKFNQQNKDQYAYKLVQVLSSETKKVSDHLLSHLALCACHLVREESLGLPSTEHNHNTTVKLLKGSQKGFFTLILLCLQMSISTIYSMTLELGRTVCGKSEGDINDCPLQDSPEQNHTSTCLFIINTQKLAVSFSMLKKNCSE
ncbi:cystatin-9, partial [Ictidomys tridecemlineatus]